MSPSPVEIAELATVAGYGVGLMAEQIASHKAAEKQARLSDSAMLSPAAEQGVSTRLSNVAHLAGRYVLAPLALTGAVAAGTSALGWTKSEPAKPTTPGLEVVVDHSGATQLDFGAKPAVEQVDGLVRAIGDRKVKGEALVAGSGTVRSFTFAKVSKDKPFGDAPLSQATGLALDRAARVDASNSTSTKANSGVVVITNGNTIGSSQHLTKTARDNETPIFIVNVEKQGKNNPKKVADLQQIARHTHGRYWAANELNVDKVIKEVTNTLAPETPTAEVPGKDLLKILGGLSLIAGIGYFRRRKNYALGTRPGGM